RRQGINRIGEFVVVRVVLT
ncbi:hypothetical protein MTO96_025548, partial [Rhipicephalus appendiculatus]